VRAAGGWIGGAVLVAMIVAVPSLAYRAGFEHAKRFRVVADGKLYRSGQFTARGLEEILDRHGIRTVINLQFENPDPLLPAEWQGKPQFRESDLCLARGVRYVRLEPDRAATDAELAAMAATGRPYAIDQFLSLMDDPANHPVLIHCKAGLHRTGRLTAVYRMEYEGWSNERAMHELKANGYGDFKCTDADEFFVQYVRNYRPRQRYAPLPYPMDKKPISSGVVP
jgi:protein tyrosine phosphatase (PTP) superfamily phosphohydrolase (DUF442 family)